MDRARALHALPAHYRRQVRDLPCVLLSISPRLTRRLLQPNNISASSTKRQGEPRDFPLLFVIILNENNVGNFLVSAAVIHRRPLARFPVFFVWELA